MSEIDGPKGIGGAPPVQPASTAEADAAADAAWVGAAASSAPAPLQAQWVSLFDRVADQLRAGQLTDRTDAVRAAVDAVLADQMSDLDASTRSALSGRVAAALLEQPGVVARLDRLIGAAGESR